MFIELINLYKRQKKANRTPLEDFNTECLAGILKMYPDIKKGFTEEFLLLPSDNYEILTQVRKTLPDKPNCIIDLVIKGDENVCFVENKVESKEGWEQLDRYSEVLKLHYEEYQHFLFYCTKYSDPKNQNKEYNDFNFRQFKWFEIGQFLRPFRQNKPLIKDYLNFLSHYKMSMYTTLQPKHLLAMENLLSTIELIEFYIDNSKDDFEKIFSPEDKKQPMFWNGQLRRFNRFCHYGKDIIQSDSREQYSEVLYSINLDSLKLATHIFVKNNHPQYKDFKRLNDDNKIFKCDVNEKGTVYFIDEDLGKFINDENADKSIKDWFLKSFYLFAKLIKDNSQIIWQNVKIPENLGKKIAELK